jgi:hypothetical protein
MAVIDKALVKTYRYRCPRKHVTEVTTAGRPRTFEVCIQTYEDGLGKPKLCQGTAWRQGR